MATLNILEECLREGFIDYKIKADERYVPRMLINNKEKHIKVLDTILTQLEHCNEFFFSVAFITKSGIACLKDALLQNKNAKGKILASQYLNFTEPNALRELLKFNNIEIRMVIEEQAFHAKGYLFHFPHTASQNDTMIIGSSNLTANALTTNQEWNVFFTSSKNGSLIRQMHNEFYALWDIATPVTEKWLKTYEDIYIKNKVKAPLTYVPFKKILPNKMQQDALAGIAALRQKGEDRGLLISATGTGKTYLSAFDVKRYNPKRFLFIVHREVIAKDAQKSYEKVGFSPMDIGLLSGQIKEFKKKYLFAMIQTISKDKILHSFTPDTFDYIVVDEVHRGGAKSYQKIFNYFRPKFWLGMTATPERNDGFNIYDIFNHNIAYEIRLHNALEENMLVPFHYHGIREIEVNGNQLDDYSNFLLLTCKERIKHILYYANLYGSDTDRVKGLVFCSQVKEAKELAHAFQKHGKRALALTGLSSENERENAIQRLEADKQNCPNYLDYILTCDIFNEGVDIPQVNQIILLRPTQSAIIFIQQLGRGLRKWPHKRYLEVLDFIGNYKNNFLIPIALYGDRTYNKDFVRQQIYRNYLPGASSVYFDDIAKVRIYKAIDTKKQLSDYKNLKKSYNDMKFRLGRTPMMMDFVHFGDRDPWLFIRKKESYYNFVQSIEHNKTTLTEQHVAILKMLSLEISCGKRIEEIIILKKLLSSQIVYTAELAKTINDTYSYLVSTKSMESIATILSLKFFKKNTQKKYGNIPLINFENHVYMKSNLFSHLLQNIEFRNYVEDILNYGEFRFNQSYKGHEDNYINGFIRYEKYSRKDVSRILNYKTNYESILYGYQLIDNTCPIFVTYNKSDTITSNTKYEDKFITPQYFSWMTRANVTLRSKQISKIKATQTRKLLFIKKNDAEGNDFYYMGDLSIIKEPTETTIKNDKGKKLPIVNFQFMLDKPVENKLYEYLNSTEKHSQR